MLSLVPGALSCPDGVGPPRAREGAWDQREHPGKFPALAPVAPVASQGSCRGAWSGAPGPGSPQVNAFCGHQGPQAADAFTGRGVRALWDPGPSGHSPFSGSPAQTLESRCVSVHVCRLGAGWGLRSQERLLAPQAGLRPEAPRETGSLGVGPARPGPCPPGAEPGRAPHPGPGSLVLPWHSASAGVGDALASVVHGKRNGPLGGGESFQFHGQDPRDPVKQA